MIDTISRQTIDEQLQTIGQVLYGIERGGEWFICAILGCC